MYTLVTFGTAIHIGSYGVASFSCGGRPSDGGCGRWSTFLLHPQTIVLVKLWGRRSASPTTWPDKGIQLLTSTSTTPLLLELHQILSPIHDWRRAQENHSILGHDDNQMPMAPYSPPCFANLYLNFSSHHSLVHKVAVTCTCPPEQTWFALYSKRKTQRRSMSSTLWRLVPTPNLDQQHGYVCTNSPTVCLPFGRVNILDLNLPWTSMSASGPIRHSGSA